MSLSRKQIDELILDGLIEIWSKDCLIDETELASETLKINSLQAKYYNILSIKNIHLKKIIAKYKRVYKLKFEYYTGKTSTEDLKKFGWAPFQYNINRNDLSTYIDADGDIIKVLEEKEHLEEMIEYCKGVIKELNNRTWQIKNAIDFHKLTRGMQ